MSNAFRLYASYMVHISCFTGGIAQTNGYLVESSQGNFVVDAPEGFAAWVKKSGVMSVEALLLTHQHFDHCQDAAAVQKEFGAKVYSFAEFSRELTLEFLMGFVSGTRFEVAAFEVDEILEGRDEIEVAGLKWKLAHVPGHSLDSVTFYQGELGLWFGGDVLFEGGVGRTDFPNGSSALLMEGIKTKVLTLPDETRVLPGHGGETTVGDERVGNPFLTGL
ncbi:MBL fold metallo-hydrolase [Phragmitibacter flavus]|uniref:MBL fold metallo-hydrolase n=1 Tax=Phragmitibacter flavus TaxID=2576071 RepID=UPI00197EBBA4|nr:MBL fold metallo-hydrolase [Phragmitibacter flavus]